MKSLISYVCSSELTLSEQDSKNASVVIPEDVFGWEALHATDFLFNPYAHTLDLNIHTFPFPPLTERQISQHLPVPFLCRDMPAFQLRPHAVFHCSYANFLKPKN